MADGVLRSLVRVSDGRGENPREPLYGVSCARPFARRRLMTRRPALVAIRARKPCVRARFNLLGWNVRFMCLLPVVAPRQCGPGRKEPARVRGLHFCVNRTAYDILL